MARMKAISGGRPRRNSNRRLPLLAILFGFSVVLILSGSLEAYRFFSDGRTDARIVGAEHAMRWQAEVWGPGDTLSWEIAPDPDFEVYFDSPEGVIPYAERALAAWSDIPTADVRWQVNGIGEGDHEDLPQAEGRHTVFVDAGDDSCGGYARIWSERRSSGRWEIAECDVAFCAQITEIPEWVEPDSLDEHRKQHREGSVGLLVHEFGHCLGLAHAGAVSTQGRWTRKGDWDFVHPGDPAMSYGVNLEEPEDLSADDALGASLLRPAPGWRRRTRTGSIAGALDLAGEAVPYAHVWALPAGEAPLRDRIGAFSDREGAFLIEGLPPGDYALWAQPINRSGAHGGLVSGGAPIDLDDTIPGRIVRVQEGQAAGGVEIPMRRGRSVRQPPDVFLAGQTAEPPVPITREGAAPCRSVRIRSVPPYLAGGPLWFTRRNSYLRGDRWFATELTLEWSPGSENTVFDWSGSYRDWWWDAEEDQPVAFQSEGIGASSAVLDVNISDYRIERDGPLVRHTMEIAWPESTEASLRFRSEDDACEGEPMVVCSLDIAGCELRRR